MYSIDIDIYTNMCIYMCVYAYPKRLPRVAPPRAQLPPL